MSVFKCRPHHPVTNMHTLEKSVFDEEANLFSLQKDNKGCAEVISVTLSLCFMSLIRNAQHLNIYEGQVKTIFVQWRPVVSQWNRIMKKPISPFVKAM